MGVTYAAPSGVGLRCMITSMGVAGPHGAHRILDHEVRTVMRGPGDPEHRLVGHQIERRRFGSSATSRSGRR
jgi:hypothetical protein